jgi:peptide-methionine (R)-S-oxide reductase
MMKTRIILVPVSIAASLIAGSAMSTKHTSPGSAAAASRATDSTAAAGGVACNIADRSACGLPSDVVIDMAQTTVRHTDDEWRALLTPEQFQVTRKQGTEPPFRNAFWNDHRDGVYFSVCSDTPLFDSRDKFESGTGWPSFTKPIEPAWVSVAHDTSYGMVRDEVHCSIDGAHLGHVFDDGPPPSGKRYCINSASLRFMPRAEYDAWVASHSSRTEPTTR